MKEILRFILIFLLLVTTVFIKYQFFLHPNSNFYLMSNSDIMSKAPEFLRKPIPIPYVESYIEYPVLTGLWASFVGSLSNSAKEYFFLNGIFLSFFSTLNILLARSITKIYFGKDVGWGRFLMPSLLFFTFFNWDVLALFFLLSALYYSGKSRIYPVIFLAGLGFWSKVFPVLALPAVCLNLLQQKKYLIIFLSLIGLILISLLLNFPFYFASHDGWTLFFTFSSKRPPNIDSVWSGIYVVTDKIFGSGFYYKRYYEIIINYITFGLMFAISAIYYLFKLYKRSISNVVIDTAFLISVFLITSKVYSPQYNLWIVMLLVIIGISHKKIMVYELFNLFLTWAVYQYFWQVFIVGRSILPFPYFKLTFTLSVLRHVSLIMIAVDIWRLSFRKPASYEKSS